MNRIYTIRQSLGLTQRELGNALGCQQSMLTHYEQGRTSMPVQRARRLIEFASKRGLSLTLDEIYGPPPGKRKNDGS